MFVISCNLIQFTIQLPLDSGHTFVIDIRSPKINWWTFCFYFLWINCGNLNFSLGRILDVIGLLNLLVRYLWTFFEFFLLYILRMSWVLIIHSSRLLVELYLFRADSSLLLLVSRDRLTSFCCCVADFCFVCRYQSDVIISRT